MKRLILILTISSRIFSQDVTDSTEVMSTDIPENFTNFGVYLGVSQVGVKFVNTVPGVETGSTLALPNIGLTKGVILGSFPLTLGLGYGHRGGSRKFDGMESKMLENYLDLFVGMGYPAGPINLTGMFLLGTSLGSGKVEVDGVEQDLEDIDFGEFTDYGLIFGVNYPINENISLDAGYYLGLADVDEVNYNGLTFSLGYKF